MTDITSLPSAIRTLRYRAGLAVLMVSVMVLSARPLCASEMENPGASKPAFADQNQLYSGSSTQVALIAEGWSWNQFFSPIKTILGSRARMLQFGAIGCCIALYIIWWRK